MYLIYVDLIVYIIAKKLFKEQIVKGIDINKHNDVTTLGLAQIAT